MLRLWDLSVLVKSFLVRRRLVVVAEEILVGLHQEALANCRRSLQL